MTPSDSHPPVLLLSLRLRARARPRRRRPGRSTCARKPRPTRLRRPRPPSCARPSPRRSIPASAQMKPLPGHAPAASAAPKPKASPLQLAADANHKAAQAPGQSDYFNAIVQYAYEPGTLYQVYAQPMRITDIALEPGEKILGEPASGDVVRWLLALGKSMQSGVEQWHVYLKPTRPDLETNLAINTDRRSYLLELHSYADTYMAAIVWHYPEDELARLQAQAAELAGQQKNAEPGRRRRRAQLRLHDPGRQRQAGVDAGAGLRRRAAHLRPLSRRPWCCARRPRSSSFATPRRSSSTTASRTTRTSSTGSSTPPSFASGRRTRRSCASRARRARRRGRCTRGRVNDDRRSRGRARARRRSTRTRPSSRPTTRACALGRPRGRTLRAGPIAALLASLLGAGVLAVTLAFQPAPEQDASRRGAERRDRRRRSFPTPSGTPEPRRLAATRAVRRGARGARASGFVRGGSRAARRARHRSQGARRGDPLRVGARSSEERSQPEPPARGARSPRPDPARRPRRAGPPIRTCRSTRTPFSAERGASPRPTTSKAPCSTRGAPTRSRPARSFPPSSSPPSTATCPGPSSRRSASTSTTRSRAITCSCRRAVACIAQYDSMVAWGQERVLVCWNRLILPNGDSIDLQCMPAADLQGAAGLADEVNEHWWRILKGAAVATLLSAGTAYVAGDTTSYNPTRRSGHGAERRGGDRPGGRADHAHATSASSRPSPCVRASRSTSSSPRT